MKRPRDILDDALAVVDGVNLPALVCSVGGMEMCALLAYASQTWLVEAGIGPVMRWGTLLLAVGFFIEFVGMFLYAIEAPETPAGEGSMVAGEGGAGR